MAAETAPYGRVTQKPSPVAEVHILWITAGLGCDGDSVSITAATQPALKMSYWELFPAFRKCTCTILCWPMKSAMTS
jgi:hypothetical protein